VYTIVIVLWEARKQNKNVFMNQYSCQETRTHKGQQNKKSHKIKNRMTLRWMQKPREKMQGKILMGEVKKKKTKGTKGVGQNENADTKKQTLFQLNDNRGEKHG